MTSGDHERSDASTKSGGLLGLIGSDGFAKLVLVVSLCAIFYSIGAATILFEAFPYKELRNVAEGFRARLAIEKDNLPVGFDGWVDATIPPTITPHAGDGPLLISGGPGRRLDLCPTHGCLAYIIDRQGRVLHTWEIDFHRIIEADTAHVGRLSTRNLTAIGMQLGKDGSLVVTFQGRNLFPYQVGIAKVSRDSKILWARSDLSHHWPIMRDDGVILSPFAKVVMDKPRFGATGLSMNCKSGAIYDEGVRAVAPDGSVLFERPFLDLLSAAGLPGLFYSINNGCDPLHVNSIDVASAADAAASPGVSAGDILVSVRELATILLLNSDATIVKRSITGRTAGQHSARFAPGGGILVFDNQGGDKSTGGSRVLHLDIDGGNPRTVFPKIGGVKLRSLFQGYIDPDDSTGRLLVTSSDEGIIYELSPIDGEVLWRFDVIEPTALYRSHFGVKPEKPFARYGQPAAYYVHDASFITAH